MGGLFLAAYNVLTPGVMVALSVLCAVALANSFYWLAYHNRMVQRPAGLLAIAGAFMGTATFYIVLMTEPQGVGDVTRGASRILWTALCLSTLYSNSGAAVLTVRKLCGLTQGD